ncbi:MAG: Fur family transcriptional regulator [Lautropia sp.]
MTAARPLPAPRSRPGQVPAVGAETGRDARRYTAVVSRKTQTDAGGGRIPPPRPARVATHVSSADLARRLADAHAHCVAHGGHLTAQRREVLELLLRRGGSAKAYDLQEDLQARHGRIAPTTIYRALDFLIDYGLVHRVDAVNVFVACNGGHDDHQPLFLVCSSCETTTELHDDAAVADLVRRVSAASAGFHQTSIEIKGLCRKCQAAAAA